MSPLDDGIEATITTPVASTRPSSSIFSHSQQNELMIGETSPNVMDEDSDIEEVPTQSQFELTQQTQELTPDECSNLPPLSLSPPPAAPWGRLVPCVPAAQAAVELSPDKDEYWFGRSSTKSDVAIQAGVGLCKKEKVMMAWAHSMISNRHCRIFKTSGGGSGSSSPPSQIIVENASGNGTWINSTIWLRKGEQRILHSGDEICLVNPMTLRKKLSSERVLQAVMQQYSFIFIQSVNRKPCVNPRAMNYCHNNRSTSGSGSGACSPRSSGRRIEAYYDLKEVLGDGTSGQVRRGIHRQTGKECAVKIISLRRHMDTKSMEDEVNMLRSLDHPYIVQLSDVFVQPGIAMYLVMELVAGGDLFDRIVEQQRYPEVEARRLMRRLLSAVYYLHENCNIVHRDLKPENILCSSPTEVKLADFGLAKMIESDGLKTFCGTPQYFAPEVLERRHTSLGQGRYGKPADMWSLGVVLYILLAGAPPFGADIDTPQQFTIDFEESLWRGMPLAEDLVQQMLRTDPKRRLSIRQACDHPWINMDDGDTHIHPLDDPNVTTRKRLFAESEIGGEKRRLEDTASESASLDDGNNSVASKGSIMSKEDFAHAAVSHCRDDSVFHLSPEKLSSDHQNTATIQSGQQIDNVCGNQSLSSSQREESSPMEISPSKNAGFGENRSDNRADDPVHAQHNECEVADSPIVPIASTSPEAAVALHSQTSVTPECDEVSPHRSPLETLNLNERTKRFRDRVLSRAGEEDEDRPSSPGIGGTIRRRDGSAVGVAAATAAASSEDSAVTPHISNVRNKALDDFGLAAQPSGLAAEEDPILSEFSSGPSSLESFPDTPPAKTKTTRKRPFEDSTTTNNDGSTSKMAEDAPPPQQQPDNKKRRTKQKRQTTLSSWFVTKKNGE